MEGDNLFNRVLLIRSLCFSFAGSYFFAVMHLLTGNLGGPVVKTFPLNYLWSRQINSGTVLRS